MSKRKNSGYLSNCLLYFGAAAMLIGVSAIAVFTFIKDKPLSSNPEQDTFVTVNPEVAYSEELGDSSQTSPAVESSNADSSAAQTGDNPATGQIENGPEVTPFPIIYNDEGIPMAVTWGNYPPPQYWHGTQIPPPMGILPRSDGQIIILLMGNDHSSTNKGARTDVNMLLVLNIEEGTATVTSFPRDLYIYAPGHTMMRLNSVQGLGGFELSALTYEYNFGIRPDHYVNVNVENFPKIIDLLGGIDVYVPQPVSDPDFANGKFSVPAGIVHMDGKTARWYVRSRAGTSDFERNIRQQEVLQSIFLRLISRHGVNNAAGVYRLYSDSVLTDLTVEDVIPLAPLGLSLSEDLENVRRYYMGLDHTIPYTSPSGGQTMLLDHDRALVLLVQALSPWPIGE
jgi:LCP family protein required for cell wall assembly